MRHISTNEMNPNATAAEGFERVSVIEALATATALFKRVGATEDNAAAVSHALVQAEAEGVRTHGLTKALGYAEQVHVGRIDGRAIPIETVTGPGSAMIDARGGLAYAAVLKAEDVLVRLVEGNGVAAVGIYNSNHAGALGQPVERLAKKGLLAIGTANSAAGIRAWGGNRAIFGTNPIAVACPAADGEVFALDMATSSGSRSAIMEAQRLGQPIPIGWALDRMGLPTTDPAEALEGTLLAVGGDKGIGVALLVELLACGLTGATLSADAAPFSGIGGAPSLTGQMFIALDPKRFGGDKAVDNFARLADLIQGSGGRLPGQRRAHGRLKAEHEGMVVESAVLHGIRVSFV